MSKKIKRRLPWGIACVILVVLITFDIYNTFISKKDRMAIVQPIFASESPTDHSLVGSFSQENTTTHPKIPNLIPTTNDLRFMLTNHLLDRSLKCLSDTDVRREKAFYQGDCKSCCESIRRRAAFVVPRQSPVSFLPDRRQRPDCAAMSARGCTEANSGSAKN